MVWQPFPLRFSPYIQFKLPLAELKVIFPCPNKRWSLSVECYKWGIIPSTLTANLANWSYHAEVTRLSETWRAVGLSGQAAAEAAEWRLLAWVPRNAPAAGPGHCQHWHSRNLLFSRAECGYWRQQKQLHQQHSFYFLLSLFFPWHTRMFLSFTCHKYNSSKQANNAIFLQRCLKFPFFPQAPETRVRTWKFALKKSSVHFLLSCLEDAVTFPDSKWSPILLLLGTQWVPCLPCSPP